MYLTSAELEIRPSEAVGPPRDRRIHLHFITVSFSRPEKAGKKVSHLKSFRTLKTSSCCSRHVLVGYQVRVNLTPLLSQCILGSLCLPLVFCSSPQQFLSISPFSLYKNGSFQSFCSKVTEKTMTAFQLCCSFSNENWNFAMQYSIFIPNEYKLKMQQFW